MPYRTRTCLTVLAFAALLAALPLTASAQVNFTAELFGQAEVPPVTTEEYGSCLGVLSEDETLFTLSCEHTVDDAATAHIHTGFVGEAGPVVLPLGDPASPIQAEWALSGDDVVRLLAGGFYVNVHNAAHPDGIIRGQLLPTQPTEGRSLSIELTGDQVVPPVDTDASGACFIGVGYVVEPFLPVQTVTLELRCTHDLAGVTGAELVLAPAGENGTTTIDLGDGTSPLTETVVLDSQTQINAFFQGNWYVSFSTGANPGGELRGQLSGCENNPHTLCLNDNRFKVTMTWNTLTDAGDAVARRETIDSGLFWFFRPSNLESLVKVLDGCGVNDHYWVFVASTTDVGYQLRVTDTQTGDTATYSNTRGTVAQPRLDTAAFDTCP